MREELEEEPPARIELGENARELPASHRLRGLVVLADVRDGYPQAGRRARAQHAFLNRVGEQGSEDRDVVPDR